MHLHVSRTKGGKLYNSLFRDWVGWGVVVGLYVGERGDGKTG